MTLTPGAGEPAKTKEATEVESTEQGKTPEPTETGGENKDQKTPNPNPQPTEKIHMTRTAGPTQVCNTPTPGVNTDTQHRNPCGPNKGGKKTSGNNQDGNIFVSAWNSLFHNNHH